MQADKFRLQPYSGSADLDRILAAAGDSWCRIGADSQVHPGNVCWRLGKRALDGLDGSIGLWCDEDGRLLAFAFQNDGSPADLHIDPRWRESESLLNGMLDWADSHLDVRDIQGGSRRPASIGCLGQDGLRRQLLMQRAFTRAGRSYQRLVRDISCRPDGGLLPAGYAIRATHGSAEMGAWLDVHHLAFRDSELTADELRRVRSTPGYRPELDRVVVDPNDQLASFAIGWFDAESATMEFEPVGCKPDQQRKGLGRALMFDLIARAAALGARQVSLTARHDHPGVIAFYQACGFRLHTMEYEYRGPVVSTESPCGADDRSDGVTR